MASGGFQLVIDDDRIADKKQIKRVVMCSGKVYYDLMVALEESKQKDIAVIRVEQLYPIPHKELSFIFNSYPGDVEIAWCQEEPRNQGAWYQTMHNLRADMHAEHPDRKDANAVSK